MPSTKKHLLNVRKHRHSHSAYRPFFSFFSLCWPLVWSYGISTFFSSSAKHFRFYHRFGGLNCIAKLKHHLELNRWHRDVALAIVSRSVKWLLFCVCRLHISCECIENIARNNILVGWPSIRCCKAVETVLFVSSVTELSFSSLYRANIFLWPTDD